MDHFNIRKALPGEASLVVHFYYKLFEEQFDFYPSTEQYFLHAMEDYFSDPNGNILYIVEQNGEILGSVCIVKINDNKAQLRMFGISSKLQGKGVGKLLMEKAMTFCKTMGYKTVILWTIDICQSARHLYSKFGFNLVDTKPNDTWADYHMTEELWEYNE